MSEQVQGAWERYLYWQEGLFPDPAKATIKLIDALRDYVEVNDLMGQDLRDEGEITATQFAAWKLGAERKRMLDMLHDLEAEEVDPSLQGMVRA